MSLMGKSRGPRRAETGSSRDAGVLLMSENGVDLASCRELLRLPGCKVQTCSNYVELLLHLEHETFQFVIILEGGKSSPEWQAAVAQVAETARGIPVLFIKRSNNVAPVNEAVKGQSWML